MSCEGMMMRYGPLRTAALCLVKLPDFICLLSQQQTRAIMNDIRNQAAMWLHAVGLRLALVLYWKRATCLITQQVTVRPGHMF